MFYLYGAPCFSSAGAWGERHCATWVLWFFFGDQVTLTQIKVIIANCKTVSKQKKLVLVLNILKQKFCVATSNSAANFLICWSSLLPHRLTHSYTSCLCSCMSQPAHPQPPTNLILKKTLCKWFSTYWHNFCLLFPLVRKGIRDPALVWAVLAANFLRPDQPGEPYLDCFSQQPGQA